LVWVDRRFGGMEQVWLQPPKDAFVRVPDEILKTAVFLGRETDKGLEYGGTGYVISVHYGPGYAFTTEAAGTINASRYPLMFLVTAAHVAEELEGFDFHIRSNFKDGSLAEIRQDSSTKWWYHPTEREAVDAALMVLPVSEILSLDIVPIPVLMFADADAIQRHNLGIGDQVFIAGLFKNAKGKAKNIPIVRIGHVAMTPEEKLLFRDKNNKEKWLHANLLDAYSIGGLSGSPVFIRETIQTHWGYSAVGGPTGNKTRLVYGPFWFFGSMIGHWRVPLSFGDVQEEARNMGIAPIVPAGKILEILTQPELVQVMNTLHQKIRQDADRKDGIPTLDSAFSKAEERPFTKEDFEDALKKVSRKKSDAT
jgi:hypothetical protein